MSAPLGPLRPWSGTAEAFLAAQADRPQLRWLRGSRMRTRRGLLDEWAAAAQFPPHFGGTWDALRDVLADLPQGGTFLVLEADQVLAEAAPGEGATLVALLQRVAGDLTPRPFEVVLQAEPGRYPALLETLASWRAGHR